MKRLFLALAIGFAVVTWLPVPAQASFGFYGFDVAFTDEDGAPVTQAGSHPFAMTTSFGTNFSGGKVEGRFRDVIAELPPGFVADTTAYPRCSTLDFLTEGEGGPACPLDTVIGIDASSFGNPGTWVTAAVFNLTPPPGVLLRLGFNVLNGPNIVVDGGLSPKPP